VLKVTIFASVLAVAAVLSLCLAPAYGQSALANQPAPSGTPLVTPCPVNPNDVPLPSPPPPSPQPSSMPNYG
jgi:hypothetical protein